MEQHFPIDLAELQERGKLGRDYPSSFVALGDAAVWLENGAAGKQLAVLSRPDGATAAQFSGTVQPFLEGYVVKRCTRDAANALALRNNLPWLRPDLLGLATSAGFGDRLGLATPGHVRALEQVLAQGRGRAIAPIFAQQSIREMSRTNRTPVEVLTDATWGAFQAGWRGPVGADADHLKTLDDIDTTAAAGFTFFTIDPGEYVDNTADNASGGELRRKVEALPWAELESDPDDLRRRSVGERIALQDRAIALDEEGAMRAAAKYGGAVAHVVRMYRHLAASGVPFELEISVDETETHTTHQEHVYVARELQRLGVRWVSLAPRYVGRFEKGVDYIGDLGALREDLAVHAAIARALGPYKLSLHSGSDKFSVYPPIVEATGGMVHLKTAGTSYLEALRVVAAVDPRLFREILGFARSRYAQDRASYHVSGELSRVAVPETLQDAQLPQLLDDFDARQVLHVTFGSTLAEFGPHLFELLRANEAAYTDTIARHFVGHLEPFAKPS